MSAPHTAGVFSERTLFLGPRVPIYMKSLSKLSSIKKPLFRSLVKLAVLDFEGKEVTPEMYQSIKNSAEEGLDIDLIYGALYSLMRSALSFPESTLKLETFKEDLRELRIPDDYIGDIANAVYGPRRSVIEANSIKNGPHLPKLQKFRWRCDVEISTSSLSRVLEPSVVMEMTNSNGIMKTFEVHPTQFHQLRYAVATLLKEMDNLEKRSVLKL